MKVEWKKWPEKGYPNSCWVWLYNDDAVSLRRVTTLPDDMEGYYYSCVNFPDPPEKKYHNCIDLGDSDLLGCGEWDEGGLYIVIRTSSGTRHIPVKSCPFCGFTLEKK